MNRLTRRQALRFATVVAAWFLAVVLGAPPVGAHGGTADGSRPFVTAIEPALPGIAASAVFAGNWQLNLSVVSGQDVSVPDDRGRAFLRIGRNGVEGDYGTPAWYTSAVAPNASGVVRLPDGVGVDTPPDWRPVSRTTTWAWFDPRITSQPGDVTPDMISKAVPARLRDFSVPLQLGDRTAQIKGYVEFEPPRGRYVHRLLSAARPAPGIEVGLLEGQAVPTLTVRDDSGPPVTVLGSDGEPFLRVGEAVEANVASPTWVQVGRALGRTPKAVADPRAEPRWERLSEGHLLSWTDFRSRPPDSEPPLAGLRPGHRIEVRRWTIPLRLGLQPAEISGVTEFEPFRPPGHESNTDAALVVAATAGAVGLVAAAVIAVRRRGSRSPR